MINFENYIERKRVEPVIEEIAQLMVEQDVEPADWLADYLEREHPEVFATLTEAGFWGGVKDFAGKTWDSMKTAGGHLANAGQQIGKDVKNNFAGPAVKFKNAIQTIEALVQQMQSDQDLKQIVHSKGGSEIHQMLTNISQRMRTYAANDLATQQQTAPTTGYTGAPAGNLGY